MRIGIDARLIDETGVGTYIRNLLTQLSTIDKTNTYVLFLSKKAYESYTLPNPRWEKYRADIPWHSILEQLIMPLIFKRAKLDLVHIPYFNIPIFYTGRMIVTMHDVTILHFDTGKASTLPLLFYKLRRLGYLIVLRIGLRRVGHILSVSQTTKQEIIDHFNIRSDNITVTYEGVSDHSKQASQSKHQMPVIKDPYFLYVGNAYPHKNLDFLLSAFQRFLSRPDTLNKIKQKLILVGKNDFFYKRLMHTATQMGLTENIVFFGEATQPQLKNLYQNATALISPSLMEGFGLPNIEAISYGCPVIVSDIPVFHEILVDMPLYFNPKNSDELADTLILAIQKNANLRSEIIRARAKSLARFSWKKMARVTHTIYCRLLQ